MDGGGGGTLYYGVFYKTLVTKRKHERTKRLLLKHQDGCRKHGYSTAGGVFGECR